VNIKALIGSALLLGGLMCADAFAQTCTVTTQDVNGARFYVPRGGDGTYNILGWGNGTGGDVNTYTSLLTAAAQRCVLVAAATTANSGSGVDVQNAVNQARTRFAGILNQNPRICISGHSQGGGGSFNAANLLGAAVANCIIAVQPDTVATVRIQRPVAATVDVTCIFSRSDFLAPASRNAGNCRNNSTIYKQVSTAGGHFAPIGTTGGAPGAAQRVEIDRLLR
jgi:hypothetical protein